MGSAELTFPVAGAAINGRLACCRPPTILGLLATCRPATIAWFVVSVCINTLDGMLRRWAAAHVLQKVFKRFLPAITNQNSTSTIQIVHRRIRIIAAIFHGVPRIVFTTSDSPTRFSVRRDFFFLQATARPVFSTFQIIPECQTRLSAITKTLPLGLNRCDVRAPQNQKPPESLSVQVNKFWHRKTIADNLCLV